MTDSKEVVVQPPRGGEELVNVLGARVLIRVTGAESGGGLMIAEAEHPAGSPPAPLHIHDHEEETLYVLEGRLVVEVDGEEHDAPAGSLILIPRGVAQRFWNPDDVPARYLSIFSPAGQEGYFRQAYSLDTNHLEYPERLAAIRKKFGLRYPDAK